MLSFSAMLCLVVLILWHWWAAWRGINQESGSWSAFWPDALAVLFAIWPFIVQAMESNVTGLHP